MDVGATAIAPRPGRFLIVERFRYPLPPVADPHIRLGVSPRVARFAWFLDEYAQGPLFSFLRPYLAPTAGFTA